MKKLLLFAALFAVSFTSFAQVGIGTTTPEESAALDITSTTSGFLPPRMTKVQLEAIDSPAEGLMVYCTDCVPKSLYVFDAFNFVSISNNTPSSLSSTDVYSTTGKTWMDRNLGATMVSNQPRAAFTSNESYIASQEDSFGDLYQWGRNTDGHEKRDSDTSDGPVDDTAAAGTSFITNNGDWLSTNTTSQAVNNARWNSGSEMTPVKVVANDPCPSGFRVPTETELEAERVIWNTNNAAGAFASVLKLPLAGYRHYSTGTLNNVGSNGTYWSSSVSGTKARHLYFNSSRANMNPNYRAFGFSVRCIKE